MLAGWHSPAATSKTISGSLIKSPFCSPQCATDTRSPPSGPLPTCSIMRRMNPGTCRRIGRCVSPSSPPHVLMIFCTFRIAHLNVRLPEGMKEKLEDYAYALDCAVTSLVTEGIEVVLAKLHKEHGDVPPRPSRLRQAQAPAPESSKPRRRKG